MPRATSTSDKKGASAKNRLTEVIPSDGERLYTCTCCGDSYRDQHAGFYRTRCNLYKANDWYAPICKKCLDELFNRNVARFGSEELAIERICAILDVPFREGLLTNSLKGSDGTRFARYMRYAVAGQYSAMSYDDHFRDKANEAARIKTEQELREEIYADEQRRLLHFWGPGYRPEVYDFLQEQYVDWTSRYECQSKAQEEVFKNICLAQYNARSAMESGNTKGYKEAIDVMQSLMADANIKPSKANDNTLADQNTFGTLIRKWEMEEPISAPDPAWKDVDGIRTYISTWFFGHLCAMVGIKNDWSMAYEQEIKQHTVSPPHYEEEQGERTFADIFGEVSDDAEP